MGRRTGSWTSDDVLFEMNLVTFDGACIKLTFSILVWSSEPNSFEKKAGIRVDGYQLGQDFTRLRKMMSEFQLYKNAALYGPDISQPRDHRADILEG